MAQTNLSGTEEAQTKIPGVSDLASNILDTDLRIPDTIFDVESIIEEIYFK